MPYAPVNYFFIDIICTTFILLRFYFADYQFVYSSARIYPIIFNTMQCALTFINNRNRAYEESCYEVM